MNMQNRPARAATLLLLACAWQLLASRAAAEEFQREVPAHRGMRLDVRLFGGEVRVHAWDRDVVRIRATHFSTDRVDVRSSAKLITARARTAVGKPHAIDIVVDVPSWMPVAVAGTYLDVTIEGVRAEVSAQTVRGDVRLTGGCGTISLKSLEGDVVLEAAEGRASLTSVNNGIRVSGFSGELVATTVNGSVSLEEVRGRAVEVGTVDGDISWRGPLLEAGRYQFATHGGDIDLALDRAANAAVTVRAFDGTFRSTYPAALPQPGSRNRRFGFSLGSGSARLDLETFRGTITLRPLE